MAEIIKEKPTLEKLQREKSHVTITTSIEKEFFSFFFPRKIWKIVSQESFVHSIEKMKSFQHSVSYCNRKNSLDLLTRNLCSSVWVIHWFEMSKAPRVWKTRFFKFLIKKSQLFNFHPFSSELSGQSHRRVHAAHIFNWMNPQFTCSSEQIEQREKITT